MRRFRSSVFCGTEELLLDFYLLDFQDIFNSQKPESNIDRKENLKA